MGEISLCWVRQHLQTQLLPRAVPCSASRGGGVLWDGSKVSCDALAWGHGADARSPASPGALLGQVIAFLQDPLFTGE